MLRLAVVLVLWVVPALAHAGGAAPKTCKVTGTSVKLQEVTISPRGEEPFQVGLHEIPVSAMLPAKCGAPLTLQTLGSIELTAKRDDVWLHISREVKSPDGLVTLEPGARVVDACVVDGKVRVSAVIYANDVLEGEMKRPDEYVRNVEVPCDALTLDMIAGSDDPFDDVGEDGTDHYWEMRGDAERVRLRSAPSAGATGRVLEAPNSLREIEVKKGWVFVETAGEGVNARGWISTSLLKRVPDTTWTGRGYGCTGSHGGGEWGELGAHNAIEKTGVVRADTRVYTAPTGSAWARFTSATHIKVRIEPNSAWAELRNVPGLDGSPSGSPWLHGYVPLDTVTLDP